MNPSTRSPRAEIQTVDSNYVDIIDLAAFLWKARIFIIIGIIVGISVSLVIQYYFKPTKYLVEIPATVEFLATNDEDGMFSRFNSTFTTRKNAEILYKTLTASATPEITEALNKMLLNSEKFIALQTSGSLGKIPFMLSRAKTGGFSFQGQFRANDSQALVTLALVAAARKVATENNEFQQADSEKIAAAKQTQDSEMQDILESHLIKRGLEEDRAKVKLLAIEANLSKQLGPTPGIVFDPYQDQIPRLLGYLKNAGKISDAELQKVSETRSKLISNMESARSRYVRVINDAQESFQVSSKRALTHASEALALIPVLKADDTLAKQVIQDGSYQRVESKTIIFLIAGILGGAIGGACAFAIRLFIRHNRERIRATFSKI